MKSVLQKALFGTLVLLAAACGGGQQFNQKLDPAALVGPVYMKILPGDQYALINSTNYNLSQGSGALLVVDLAQRKIVPQATLPLPNFTREFDYRPTLDRFYVTSSEEDSLLVFEMKVPGEGGLPVSFTLMPLSDPKNQRYGGGVHIGKEVSSYSCRYLERSGQTPRVYVSNLKSGDLSVFDPTNNQLLWLNPHRTDRSGIPLQSVETFDSQNIPLGVGANRLYLDPLSQLLLITSSRNDNIFLFDPNREVVQSVIEVRQTNASGGLRSLVVTSKREIWASHGGLDGVLVLDGSGVAANGQVGELQTARWLDFVATGKSPEDLSLHPAGNKLYVANFGENTVSVIDLAGRRLIQQIAVGDGPLQFAQSVARNELYVVNFVSGKISVIDLTSDQVLGTIP